MAAQDGRDAFTKYADAQPAEAVRDTAQKADVEQMLRRTHRESVPEQEFNFDQIFTGSDAEQVEKAGALVRGISASETDYQALYAEDVLNGSTKAANSLAKILWLRRGYRQFAKDPRGVVLAERVEHAAIHKTLDQILR